MNNPELIKSVIAETAVAAYRIVKFGSADDKVVQATASTESYVGVSNNLGGDAGKRVDIVLSGVAEVEYGGNVARGDYLTSDANGKAVTANPAAGVNANTIGTAMASGAAGDIGSVDINKSRIQG